VYLIKSGSFSGFFCLLQEKLYYVVAVERHRVSGRSRASVLPASPSFFAETSFVPVAMHSNDTFGTWERFCQVICNICRLSTYMRDPQEVLHEGDMHLKEQVTQKLRGKGAESLLRDKYVSKECALESLLSHNSVLQQCAQAKAKRKKRKSVPLLWAAANSLQS
jgi:hypothetical protein